MFEPKDYPLLSLLTVLLFLAGCGASDLEPVETLQSGPYQLELLASGGTLQAGANKVMVRVTHERQPVAAEGGQLFFTMPPMPPAMPRMDTDTHLTRNGDHLEGNISFEMGGGWDGRLEVVIPDGQISTSFRVHVR